MRECISVVSMEESKSAVTGATVSEAQVVGVMNHNFL